MVAAVLAEVFVLPTWVAGLCALAGMAFWRRSDSQPDASGPVDPADSGTFDSDRRRAEAALKESEEKYRLLIEHANDAICVAQDGLIKFFNPRLQQMLGYDAAALSVIPFTDVIAPEDRELVLGRYVQRLRGEEVPHQYEFRLLTKQGKTQWIEINSVMLTWEGRPATLCFFRDVQEQKRAEEALRESEAQYHGLVESLPLSIFCKDRAGRITFANRRFCDTLGRTLESLRGKDDFALFPREMADKYRRDDQHVLETGLVLEAIEEYRKADGEIMHIQTLKAPIYGANGEICGVQGMFWDVTARRRAAEQMRESADRQRLILETAYDAFVAIDVQGKIVEWNPQSEKAFGWSRVEALGKRLDELIIPTRFQRAYARRLQSFVERGAGSLFNNRIELSLRRRDGSEFPVEAAIAPLRVGSSWFFHAFLHDISRRKRYEAELREAKLSAEAANRAKSAFLANISHEIRTPMNAIIGMAELLLDTPLDAEQRDYQKIVLESADALLAIINDLLDFSKIEAGKFELDPVPFDVCENLGDTMKSLAVRAHKKGLELILDIAPDVPDWIVGDPNRLRQVIVNLVGNAIKFTERGEVVMTVRRAGAEAANAPGAPADVHDLILHFAVRDTGIGVPENKRDAIFQPFEQADSSTTRRYGGTGLGLSISKALVELMGGRLQVESQVGHESIFHFTAHFRLATHEERAATVATSRANRGVLRPPSPQLGVRPTSTGGARPPVNSVPGPVNRAAEATGQEVIARARALLEGLHVLVVDDNRTNRRIQCEMLRSWRMIPSAAASAAEALVLLRTAQRAGQPFTVVLTDGNMPDVDGFALAGEIAADAQLQGAIIMLLTSGDRPDDAARCRALGVRAYLMKPVKQSELLDAITGVVGVARKDEVADDIGAAANPDARSLKILLAEDSLVNQKLAVGILERRGHRVAVAENGRQALEMTAAEAFDLVLIDVQMPEMDGLDATRALREREAAAASARLPVIAMTAHAMPGDRDRCLDAGMDGYVTKPIRADDLLAAITQLISAVPAAAALQSSAQPDGTSAAKIGPAVAGMSPAQGAGSTSLGVQVDWAVALETTGGDRKLLAEIVEAFRLEAPRLIGDLRTALEQENAEFLQRSAHTLKGSLRYFGARELHDQAWVLERAAGRGELAEAAAMVEPLVASCKQLLAAMACQPP